jgi:hypothetical protein
MTTDYELEEQKKNLNTTDELVVTYKIKAKEKSHLISLSVTGLQPMPSQRKSQRMPLKSLVNYPRLSRGCLLISRRFWFIDR